MFENARRIEISDSTFHEVHGDQIVYNGNVHNAPVYHAPTFNGPVRNAPMYYADVQTGIVDNGPTYNEHSYEHMGWYGDQSYLNLRGRCPRFHLLVA